MDWFRTVSDFYKSGYYTDDQVKIFVVKGKITSQQFQKITDQEYLA
ncbi:XkdX family protein [Rummeliibacillus stabekisii]|nr:XkdX family protein [Rummeliibacillus stabekisii]MCM3316191.1 XkdX family protein [Rummeliibacillus stabekisii]